MWIWWNPCANIGDVDTFDLDWSRNSDEYTLISGRDLEN